MKLNMSFFDSLKSGVGALLPMLAVSGAVSCSPVLCDVVMDVRSKSEYSIDLHGVPPSIVSICERRMAENSSLDSALASKVAFGLAGKLEKDLSLGEGDIPVYTFYSDEMDASDIEDIKYLLTNAGSDRVIVLDSLRVKDFKVEQAGTADSRYAVRTDVLAPFSLKMHLFSLDSLLYGTSPSEKVFAVDQYLQWSLISNEPVEDSRAVSAVMGSISGAFTELGEEIGAGFTPQWKEQSRKVVAYDTGKWYRAYLYASQFKWQEALSLWMGLADGRNARRTAYAAYNAAVACEMMEKFDLAQEWLDMAGDYHSFECISEEQRNIDEGRSNQVISLEAVLK